MLALRCLPHRNNDNPVSPSPALHRFCEVFLRGENCLHRNAASPQSCMLERERDNLNILARPLHNLNIKCFFCQTHLTKAPSH